MDRLFPDCLHVTPCVCYRIRELDEMILELQKKRELLIQRQNALYAYQNLAYVNDRMSLPEVAEQFARATNNILYVNQAGTTLVHIGRYAVQQQACNALRSAVVRNPRMFRQSSYGLWQLTPEAIHCV